MRTVKNNENLLILSKEEFDRLIKKSYDEGYSLGSQAAEKADTTSKSANNIKCGSKSYKTRNAVVEATDGENDEGILE